MFNLKNVPYFLNSNILRYMKKQLATAAAKPASSLKLNTENIKEGNEYHGFLVEQITDVPEFSLEAIYLKHKGTKAEYLHLNRDDSNNVFSINFRTTPLDSTGLPHILEHTVLCGSKQYPVRDPFFKMLNRSLATFMNAMTGPDYTMYPFSTTNISDYRNLQSIYLDAVFQPNLNLYDFMQEGWRLEYSDVNNPKSDLTIKGVVFNEMKGSFAENERIFAEYLLNTILPDHTYGVISGGDPLKIPNLTWENLKQFHKNHYHPSNSRFYSYGNFPLLPTLEMLDKKYLSMSAIDTSHTEVPSQKRWTEPKKKHIECRYDSIGAKIEKQNTIAVSYLMTDISNVYDTFLLEFLTELLIRGPNSPFYKSLIEPNFSGGYCPSSGYDATTKDSVFTLGLQEVHKSDFDKVVKIFDETIDSVIKNGFDSGHISSVLHKYELGMKHEASNFGLHLLFAITALWNHKGPIIKNLKVNSLIEKLKTKMSEDPKYLQKAVEKYFKTNTHRLIFTMSPNVDYEKKFAEKEKQLLEEKTNNLTEGDKKIIFQLGKELQDQQNAPQNVNLLPTLKLQDISPTIKSTKTEVQLIKQVPLQLCEAPTNGVTYFKTVISAAHLRDQDHQMLIPLFNFVISRLGTPKYNFRDFDSWVNSKTSGLMFSTHVVENLREFDQFEKGILISSYCLDRNIQDMFAIWQEVFSIEQFTDVKRFEMLINSYMANLVHGIAAAGHLYAVQTANSLISGPAYQKELFSGLKHIKYMKLLTSSMSAAEILAKISEMAKILFDKNNLRSSINYNGENKEDIMSSFSSFVNNIKGKDVIGMNQIKWLQQDVFRGFNLAQCKHSVMNFPVHFCAKSIKTVPYTHENFAALKVLSRLLSAKYLHPIVREKNGAYGGGARINTDGLFAFYSYRDPNNIKTLDVFDGAHEFLESNIEKLTDQDIFEAKLGIFQALDAPIIPAKRGDNMFLYGLTDLILQQHRGHVLSVKKSDLLNVSKSFINNDDKVPTSKVILGPNIDSFDVSNRDTEVWEVEKNA